MMKSCSSDCSAELPDDYEAELACNVVLSSCATCSCTSSDQYTCSDGVEGQCDQGYECHIDGHDSKCRGVPYLPEGPQMNVPIDTLTSGGWTQCHTESYSNRLQIDVIQGKCSAAKTFMACKEVGSDILTLAAWANTATVFAVTENNEDCRASCTSQVEAGTRWYQTPHTWGFAAADNSLYLLKDDVGDTNILGQEGTGGTRLSFSINKPYGGYRCGETKKLWPVQYGGNGDDWERVFFHAN